MKFVTNLFTWFPIWIIGGEELDRRASINVWVTDDANHLPLMINSPLSVGSVKAVLHKHKGLRWPVKAKV